MVKRITLKNLNDDEILENKQSAKRVTVGELKQYMSDKKKNKYDGEWYLLDDSRFRKIDLKLDNRDYK